MKIIDARGDPPRWAQHVLRWVLPPHDRDTIAGDLLEEYRDVCESLGYPRACRRYVGQVLSIVASQAQRRISASSLLAGGWIILFFGLVRNSQSPSLPPAHTIPADPELFLAMTTILLVAVFAGVFLVVGWLWFVHWTQRHGPLRRL